MPRLAQRDVSPGTSSAIRTGIGAGTAAVGVAIIVGGVIELELAGA